MGARVAFDLLLRVGVYWWTLRSRPWTTRPTDWSRRQYVGLQIVSTTPELLFNEILRFFLAIGPVLGGEFLGPVSAFARQCGTGPGARASPAARGLGPGARASYGQLGAHGARACAQAHARTHMHA